MLKQIVSIDIRNVKNECVYSGVTYPEIRKYSVDGKINTLAVKVFLHENGLLSTADLLNPKCDYTPIAWGLYKAFYQGILSLNCTKQKGIINNTPIRMSTSLGGKMKDVYAFSTLSLVNPMCQARMKNKRLVCNKCYVKKSLYIWAILNYVQNSYILMNFELPIEWIPVIRDSVRAKHPFIRIESFGDLFNVLQAENYLRIVYANPSFHFGIWTKNPNYFAQAVDKYGKPENLKSTLSVSEVGLNHMDWKRWEKYFDHIFRVVETQEEKDFVLANNRHAYPCKCGNRSCIECHMCYDSDPEYNEAVELLRQ